MINFIVRENFLVKKVIERRKENFSHKNNFFIKEFEEYTPELLDEYSKRYKNGFFRYILYEMGGEAANKKDSFSQIVCSDTGEKLFPIKTFNKFRGMDKPHAIFSGTNFCLINMFYKGNTPKFIITQYKINEITGEYTETVLWQGAYPDIKNKIPPEFSHFSNALHAASRKLEDYQCARVYYAENIKWK